MAREITSAVAANADYNRRQFRRAGTGSASLRIKRETSQHGWEQQLNASYRSLTFRSPECRTSGTATVLAFRYQGISLPPP